MHTQEHSHNRDTHMPHGHDPWEKKGALPIGCIQKWKILNDLHSSPARHTGNHTVVHTTGHATTKLSRYMNGEHY